MNMYSKTMLLSDWVYETFTHVTMCTERVDPKNNSVVRIPEICRDLTVGLISTDSAEEFRDLCMSFAPVGTIKNDLDLEWYNMRMLRVRQMLSKMLLDEKNRSIAQKYLEVLERRDRSHWRKDTGKSVEMSQDNGNGTVTNITFRVVD